MPFENSVKPYHPGDEEEILELLELVFNRWPHFDLRCTPIEHWAWKFKDNPIHKIIISLSISDGKIIGCFHNVIQRLKIGNSIFLSCHGLDVAVHPNHRRKGIYTKTRSFVDELEAKAEVKFHYSIDTNPILIKQSKQRGHVSLPFTLIILVRINDVNFQLRMMPTKYAWIKKYGFRLIKLYNKFRNALRRFPSLDQNFTISEIQSFDDRINIFWNEVKGYYNFIVERSKTYLNWRYCDIRSGNYIVRQVEDESEILGYSVLRINRYLEEYPVGYIVDMLTLPDRFDIIEALVEDAVTYFNKNDINIIQFMCVKNYQYKALFYKFGFLDSRIRPFINYPPNPEIDKQLNKINKSNENKTHFVFGDYDAI